MRKQWWEADIIYYPADVPCPCCGGRDAKFTRATGRKTCCKCETPLDLFIYAIDLGVSLEGASWAMEGVHESV
jgi:hypothetical protein